MEPDADVLRQVRKGLADMRLSLEGGQPDKARYQLDCLWDMLQLEHSRRQPWSYYQPRVLEEFGDTPETTTMVVKVSELP